MFRIRTYNQISDVGLSRLPLDSYQVGPDIEEPHALILRSHKLHGEVIPDSVLAVARAGAGVNNVPLERCTEQGIAQRMQENIAVGMGLQPPVMRDIHTTEHQPAGGAESVGIKPLSNADHACCLCR